MHEKSRILLTFFIPISMMGLVLTETDPISFDRNMQPTGQKSAAL